MNTLPKETALEEPTEARKATLLYQEILPERLPLYTPTEAATTLLEELQQNGVRFAHWKSNSHLLKSLAGKTDLDLLIHPEDRAAFESCMVALGYKRLISQAWSSYPGVEDWLGMDHTTGNFLHIHTHYALVTGIQHVKHLYLPWMDAFFKNVIADEQTGWPIPAYEMEALILFVRVWAKMPPAERLKGKPTIPHYILDELVQLLCKSDTEKLMRLAGEVGLRIPASLVPVISRIPASGNPADVLQVSRLIYKQLTPAYRMPWTVALVKSNLYKLQIKAKKYASRYMGPFHFGKKLADGGKVFALVGSDGSGKSTLSKDLIAWLTYKLDTHYVYLGKNPFIKSYNKKILQPSDLMFSRNRLSRYYRKRAGDNYFIKLIQKKVQLVRLAHNMSKAGSVILCDRFPQQAFFGINDGPNLPAEVASSQQERRYFDQASNAEPDVVFRLRITPELAHSRKPEHDAESIIKKCEVINGLTFKTATLIDIDASQPYEQVLLSVKREIWKHL